MPDGRTTPGQPPLAYRFGEFEVDPAAHRLTRDGRPLAVEPRVFDALVHLIEHRDRLVTKQELFDAVWAEEFVSDNALSRAIARLRQALGDDSRRPRFIETVHGRGYRFVAAVEPLPGTAGPPPRRRLWPVATAGVVLLALLTLDLWWTRAGREGPAAEGPAARAAALPPEPLRVAVLPMRDLGDEEESRLFADGLTEQLISVLSQIDGLRVLSGTTTMTYRDAGRRISEIASELDAGTMLAGSVRRSGDELRVTVELIDAAREELLWSREFDVRPEDVFAVQSEVAARVADALQLSVPVSAVRRIREGPTRQLTAYEHYLRGRRAYRRITRAGNETAIRYYERALEVDPEFALARAELANAYALRAVRFGFGRAERQRAEEVAHSALAADPRLPEAHKALGIVAYNRGELRRALEHYEKALELNPSYDEALYNAASTSALVGAWDRAVLYQLRATHWVHGRAALASYLLRLGYAAEGERLAGAVLEEEPLVRYLSLNLAEHELFAGRVESARERIAAIIAAEPTWPRGHRKAGDAELWQGNLEAAREHYLRAVETSSVGNPESAYRVGLIDLLAGRRAEAELRLGELEERLRAEVESGTEHWLDTWILGSIAAARGDAEAALGWREKAIAAGWLEHWRDATDPGLRTLRDDPRFGAQLERMGHRVEVMRERVRPDLERALPRLWRLG